MNCVFSKELVERWRLLYIASHRKNPPNDKIPDLKDLIVFFKKYNISLHIPVMTCHVISTLNHVVEPAIYKLCTNKELQDIAYWVNENLVYPINKDNYITQGVKIRIVISKLNKLCEKGIISKDENIFFFDNVINNIRGTKSDIMCEDLPF